jgi:hypothetical protein
MNALRDTATHVLSVMLAGQPDTPAKVEFAWRVAAGPALARAATVSWGDDRILVVRAHSPEWRREIARARPIIATRLGHLLGPGTVKTIRVIEDSPCEKS